MIGSLVLQSQGSPEVLPIFTNYTTGSHTPGRNNGVWFFQSSGIEPETVYLPQRDKHITIYAKCTNTRPDYWQEVMKKWDAAELPMSQFDKLGILRYELADDVSQVCINTEGTHGSWSLLGSKHSPMFLTGVSTHTDMQIVWSSHDIIPTLRAYDPTRYSFYRFPSLVSHTFLNSQALCSKWWRWTKSFGPNVLRCFNALEVKTVLKVK